MAQQWLEKRNDEDERLRRAYTTLKQGDAHIPGALGSSKNFYDAIKKRYGPAKVSRGRVERVLGSEPAYAQFRWPKWQFPRRQMSASRVGEVPVYKKKFDRRKQATADSLVYIGVASRPGLHGYA